MKLSSYAFNNYGADARLYNGINDLEAVLDAGKHIISDIAHGVPYDISELRAWINDAETVYFTGSSTPQSDSTGSTTHENPKSDKLTSCQTDSD